MIRHAEAAPGEPDAERALTPEGQAQAEALGERLAAAGVRADAVLTSPLLRARQTGEAVAQALGCSSEPTEALAPGATADDVRAAVEGRGETIVVVLPAPLGPSRPKTSPAASSKSIPLTASKSP